MTDLKKLAEEHRAYLAEARIRLGLEEQPKPRPELTVIKGDGVGPRPDRPV